MKIFRKQWKPILVRKDEFSKYVGVTDGLYNWHDSSIDDLRKIMPYNDRIEELVNKMANEGTPRKYGGFWWKVEK